jgi:outer membrane protein OmpA-like peptidoglycan-associated protein
MLMHMMKTSCIICLLALNYALAQPGLKAEYYAGQNFEKKVLTRMDAKIDFVWNVGRGPTPLVDASLFSARWTGKLLAPASGKYTFSAKVDDGIRVWVGGKMVINQWNLNDVGDFKGAIILEEGKQYELKVEYFNAMLEGEIKLIWETPKTDNNPKKPETIDAKYFQQNTIINKKVESPKATPPKKTEPIAPKSTPKTEEPIPKKIEPQKPTTKIEPTFELKTNPPQTVEVNQSVVLKNVFFEQSSYILLPQSSAELNELAQMLAANPTLNIEIIGHTDNVGDPRLNLALSENRAKVVMNYLVQKGIAEPRIEAKGYGGKQPIASNDTEATRTQNRRVEFVIKNKK